MVSAPFLTYEVDPGARFRQAILRAKQAVEDLSEPMGAIAEDFYRSEASLFDAGGPGPWTDLADRTKRQKTSQGYSIYPILKRTGALERSVTDKNDSNASFQIDADSVRIGTKVVSDHGFPYPAVHQYGSRSVPKRPFLFIGPEAPQVANADQLGRIRRWQAILKDYILKNFQGAA